MNQTAHFPLPLVTVGVLLHVSRKKEIRATKDEHSYHGGVLLDTIATGDGVHPRLRGIEVDLRNLWKG